MTVCIHGADAYYFIRRTIGELRLLAEVEVPQRLCFIMIVRTVFQKELCKYIIGVISYNCVRNCQMIQLLLWQMLHKVLHINQTTISYFYFLVLVWIQSTRYNVSVSGLYALSTQLCIFLRIPLKLRKVLDKVQRYKSKSYELLLLWFLPPKQNKLTGLAHNVRLWYLMDHWRRLYQANIR